MTWPKHNWLVAVSFIAMLTTSIVGWLNLEGPLPVHWGLDGEPTRYGTKLEALGILPFLALVSYVTKVFSSADEKSSRNARVLPTIARVLVLGLTIIHVGTIMSYLGVAVSLSNIVALGVGIILVGVGNLMPKLAPNHLVGVRLPWLYKSEKAWYKTQRVGGWVFAVSGVAFILIGLFAEGEAALMWGTVGLLLGAAGVVAYSYWVWRNDDARTSLE